MGRHRFKASDLLAQEKTLRRIRKRNYAVQFDKCIDAVRTVNEHCHTMYTMYTVPSMIPGEPHYNMDECIIYLKEELKKSDFYVRLMKPGNILYISWKPEDVEKVKRYNDKMEMSTERKVSRKMTQKLYEPEEATPPIIEFNPDCPLSNMRLRTSLMMNNPKYDHLPSMQRLKKRYH